MPQAIPSIVGLHEWINLPELGIVGLRAKIDTGAKISSLHASDIKVFTRNNQQWVRFNAHFGTLVKSTHRCESPLIDIRTIKSSNGESQQRYIIRTLIALGKHCWQAEFSLTSRKTMQYRVLIGAEALITGNLVVDPSRSYVQPIPLFYLPSKN